METINFPKIILQRIANLQLQGKNGYEHDLAQLLSHDPATIEKWSSPLTDQERADRNNAIFDHWLAGETTVELASKAQLGHQFISDIIRDACATRLGNNTQNEQPPIYNVWNFASCDPRFGQKHPGQIPGQAVLNLLLWLEMKW